ncbi:MAG: methyltransferase [Roseovarius sp.]|nr:methyltransferase [Roseovarius sp.]
MDSVRDQYEAFPYPERDPGDERKRLVTGSPSLPQEIDHFVYGGRRDWSQPLRILGGWGRHRRRSHSADNAAHALEKAL